MSKPTLKTHPWPDVLAWQESRIEKLEERWDEANRQRQELLDRVRELEDDLEAARFQKQRADSLVHQVRKLEEDNEELWRLNQSMAQDDYHDELTKTRAALRECYERLAEWGDASPAFFRARSLLPTEEKS